MGTSGLTSLTDLTGIVAFTSGLLSFFSPCVLPLVPSYLVFISGITFNDYKELQSTKYRGIVLIHSLAFVVGFSFVFVTLGLSSSVLGRFLSAYQTYIMRIGGFMLIVLGLYYLDVIRMPVLDREKVIHLQRKPVGLFGSFLVGITFSLGWTPCVGPALSSILIIASTSEDVRQGVYLLGLYSLGLAIPFMVAALLFNQLFSLLKRYGSVMRYSVKILGVLFICIGVLFFSSFWGVVSSKIGRILSL
ncbi:cytochrome c biogenesis CcdA family protein [Syntrophorhabdus aromaticivorans]|jgi:cytochrome c-type biogenesis protein|uniref:Cytochrome C biogenesis protein CcdA n=1 Tax=Syntrophorhabdus aromaticivorans TaxID=328301 RepID=A0A971M5F8_9BACT|nr:cytochrome c biogenesis protein CcdA [Syntrophorhabdus aromaticivorans]NLW36250.1 cytochrome C biogenesis protein CcdA [Syntrophorhabdus aromaticivorans]